MVKKRSHWGPPGPSDCEILGCHRKLRSKVSISGLYPHIYIYTNHTYIYIYTNHIYIYISRWNNYHWSNYHHWSIPTNPGNQGISPQKPRCRLGVVTGCGWCSTSQPASSTSKVTTTLGSQKEMEIRNFLCLVNWENNGKIYKNVYMDPLSKWIFL